MGESLRGYVMNDDKETPQQKRTRLLSELRAEQGQSDEAAPPAAEAPEVPSIEEPDAPAPVSAAERRRQLLQGIPADIADLISDEELAQIEEEERKKAKAEEKKQALADVRAAMRQRARVEHNLIPASVLRSEEEERRRQELVTFTVNLPDGGGALGLRVDGRLYQNGMTYTEPRHVVESLSSMHYQAHIHEIAFSDLKQTSVFKRGDQNGGLRASQILYARHPAPFMVH